MKQASSVILSTSPPAQTGGKPPGLSALRCRRRLPCWGIRYRPTGKELDTETGLYYFGARYLDPKTGRWISGDPAISDYIPSAPVNDEAKKQNQNLSGMGGVFSVMNLHVYHYAGNNPVKYIDPDGDNFYNYTDKDITVITEDGKAVTVHPNEMYEGGIDGAVLYDDTILKVNTFSMMAVFGTDDNYRAVALGIFNALIDLGKKLFKKNDKLSGVYEPESKSYEGMEGEWTNIINDGDGNRRNDQEEREKRVREITADDDRFVRDEVFHVDLEVR